MISDWENIENVKSMFADGFRVEYIRTLVEGAVTATRPNKVLYVNENHTYEMNYFLLDFDDATVLNMEHAERKLNDFIYR